MNSANTINSSHTSQLPPHHHSIVITPFKSIDRPASNANVGLGLSSPLHQQATTKKSEYDTCLPLPATNGELTSKSDIYLTMIRDILDRSTSLSSLNLSSCYSSLFTKTTTSRSSSSYSSSSPFSRTFYSIDSNGHVINIPESMKSYTSVLFPEMNAKYNLKYFLIQMMRYT